MENQNQHSSSQQGQSRNPASPQPLAQTMTSTQASTPLRQLHSEESWIEIGSRPSSSSLSSANEEIITTGLRVQHDSNNFHRRRRPRAASQFVIGTGYRATSGGGGSSQEEYEESESESDRVMTSSNEGIGPSPLHNEIRRSSRSPYASSETMSEREDEDEDDDENATAVNYPRSSRRTFEPRPNAFSHPPVSQGSRAQQGASYPGRRPAARPSSQRHSYPQHSPYNAVSPHYQVENDEALRASLSTLLSAARAVGGLPKAGQRVNAPTASARVDPSSLRLVPESVALGGAPRDANSTHASSTPSPRATNANASDKSKRKDMSNVRSSSKDRRAVKKARRTGPLIEEISPTLFTWIVSAGVVVVVSALSFSAGYVIGKEAGHAEAIGQLGSLGEAGSCSKEAASGLGKAGMGLRRLRWSGGSGIRV